MLDPVDVLVGIQAHVRRHAGEERVGTGVQRGHRDRPSLEVADRSDTIGAQQFEAADVLASQDDDRVSCLDSQRSEEHTSELQSQSNLVCRLLLEKKKKEEVK